MIFVLQLFKCNSRQTNCCYCLKQNKAILLFGFYSIIGWLFNLEVFVLHSSENICTVLKYFQVKFLFLFFVIGDKSLDGYSKKKYICKLLFIFLLGHDVDFGHMEAVNLTTSNRYTEKQIVWFYFC